MSEPEGYAARKAFFDSMLTIYGRNAVIEALRDGSLPCHAVHLADSNRKGGPIAEIERLAQQRGIPVKMHGRAELARISKNGKQDQGVAADIICPQFSSFDSFCEQLPTSGLRLLALDGITNPQNLGMILRSATAGAIDGILWSPRGNAALGPLVIKASAGTAYRAPIIICTDLFAAMTTLQERGVCICTLEADAGQSLFADTGGGNTLYVLGNESEGVSRAVSQMADRKVSIPMRNDVESLNVAVAASLIAYATELGK